MIARVAIFLCFFLIGCKSIVIPDDFVYKKIDTEFFEIASWQKIQNNGAIKFYIEGDGASFDAYGLPTLDPTPRGKMIRELAFGDLSSNVVYLARPCQFILSGICSQRHWTSARFSVEVIQSMASAIKQIAKDREVILIGFSGGAQVSGLIASTKQNIKIKKIITIAGNLDHEKWTRYHKLPSLNESMNLADYKKVYSKFSQIHYVGSNDKVIPKELVYDFFDGDNFSNIKIAIIEGASHSSGWEDVYQEIWRFF